MGMRVDDSTFQAGIKRLNKRADDVIQQTIDNIANEVLRLSQREVPHDTGQLQNTGHSQQAGHHDTIVGYNKVYAARLHEHPEYRFQKGRKGKYLEDPIKLNLSTFRDYFNKAIAKL